jgi:hypothetical protein
MNEARKLDKVQGQLHRENHREVGPPSQNGIWGMNGAERLALISLLDKIASNNKELDNTAKGLAIQIEELSKADKKLQKDIFDVKDLARYTLQELSKRIRLLKIKRSKRVYRPARILISSLKTWRYSAESRYHFWKHQRF